MGVIFSGMRPTGKLHIGHLVGALEKWVDLQHDHTTFFSIADWHALTTGFQDTSAILDNIYEMALDWWASGIDFEKSTVFIQSEVHEHATLHLILSMLVPIPWLERNPTLKTMIKDMHIKSINYGLMGYPVLQTADIILYKGDTVPVGEDQVPHVEMAREIVRVFNRLYSPVFPEPKALLTKTPRLLGIDGKKMSKSLNNCIYLSDSPDAIAKKTRKMVTDPQKIRKNDPGRPEVCSVFDYHKIFTPGECERIASECKSGKLGCVDDKQHLAKSIAKKLEPIRLKRESAKKEDILQMLDEGRKKAAKIANETIREVEHAIKIRR